MTVVNNVSDLTDAMRALLVRPERRDQMAQAEQSERESFRSLVRRGLIINLGSLRYRLTEQGIRCRATVEDSKAVEVAGASMSYHGWAQVDGREFEGHSVTTWMRDEHTLVLAGKYEGVTAAIYDGLPLDLDRLVETVTSGSSDQVLERAAEHARRAAPARFAAQLAELLGLFAAGARRGDTRCPLVLAAEELANAILSTPVVS